MNGSDAFRAAWRNADREAVALVSIGPLPVSGVTIRAATQGIITPDGVAWEPLLSKNGGTIAASFTLLGTDVALAKASFALLDREAAFTAPGQKLSAFIAGEQLVGAPVSVQLWEASLTAMADALQRFVGVVQSYSANLGQLSVTCMQRRDWNRSIVVKRVNNADHPQAPEDAIGQALPLVVGRLGGLPMREPFADPYSSLQHIREHIAGGVRLAPGILVDTGRGGGGTNPKAKVLVAGHKVWQLGVGGTIYGTALFIEGPDGVAHVMDPASGDLVNDASGAGFTIPDGTGSAFYPVFPCDIVVQANNADNPRAVLDRKCETRYARLSYTANQKVLTVKLPTLPEGGRFVHAYAYCIYRSSAGMSGVKLRVQNVIRSGTPYIDTTLPASSSETFMSVDLGTSGWASGPLPDQPWDFSETQLSVLWPSTGAGTVDVIYLGLTVEYLPTQSLVEVKKSVEMMPVQRPSRRGWGREPWGGDGGGITTTYVPREVLTDIMELKGKFYANVYGYPDDASGSCSGVALGLIERPCDVAQLFLRVFGQQSTAQLALSGLNGFAGARSLLKTWNGRDMVLGISYAENLDVSAALSDIMAASASAVYLSEFADKWRFLPFRVAPSTTYTDLHAADLLDPATGISLEMTPDSDVLSGVRIPYGWDALTKGYIHEVSATVGGSSSGHAYRQLRDGLLTVASGVNDKLDFGTGAGVKVATFSPGTYTPPQLAVETRRALVAAEPTRKFYAAYACSVVAGFNDKVYYADTASFTVKTATVAAGDYSSFEALCAAVQAALPTGWSVSYDRSTRRVTVNGPSTYKRLFLGTSADDVLPLLGICPAAGFVDCPASGLAGLDEGRVVVACQGALDLWTRTGTNGLTGTKQSAAELLGFDWTEDCNSQGATQLWVGRSPKTLVETQLTEAALQFGQKRDITLEGKALYDTATALELRNRLVALLRKPRAVVRFASDFHADLERGDVFFISSDLDALQPYAAPMTDGSWGGKLFLTLETQQRFGDSWHTEVVAVDVTD